MVNKSIFAIKIINKTIRHNIFRKFCLGVAYACFYSQNCIQRCSYHQDLARPNPPVFKRYNVRAIENAGTTA